MMSRIPCDFYGYIKEDDLVNCQKLLREYNKYVVTSQDVKKAARSGSLKILKFFVDNLKVPIHEDALLETIGFLSITTISYLLEHKAPLVHYGNVLYCMPVKEAFTISEKELKILANAGLDINALKSSTLDINALKSSTTDIDIRYRICKEILALPDYKDGINPNSSPEIEIAATDYYKAFITEDSVAMEKHLKLIHYLLSFEPDKDFIEPSDSTLTMMVHSGLYELLKAKGYEFPDEYVLDSQTFKLSLLYTVDESEIPESVKDSIMARLTDFLVSTQLEISNSTYGNAFSFLCDLEKMPLSFIECVIWRLKECDIQIPYYLLFTNESQFQRSGQHKGKFIRTGWNYKVAIIQAQLSLPLSDEEKRSILYSIIIRCMNFRKYEDDEKGPQLSHDKIKELFRVADIDPTKYVFNWFKEFRVRYGEADSEGILEALKNQNLESLGISIDFSDNDAPHSVEEKWEWIGIGSGRLEDGTYGSYEHSKDYPISKEFESIRTLDDLEKKLPQLNKCWNSPTACYFEIDRKTGIFYRDQQDCVLWALEDKKDGIGASSQLPRKESTVNKVSPGSKVSTESKGSMSSTESKGSRSSTESRGSKVSTQRRGSTGSMGSNVVMGSSTQISQRVYVYNPNFPFTRTFVAASLPEFLSRVQAENKQWYSNNRQFLSGA
jgi:hypothetical protein